MQSLFRIVRGRSGGPCGAAALIMPWLSLCLLVSGAAGDVLYLRNGTELRGTVFKVPGLNVTTSNQNNQGPVPQTPYWLVDDGVRRFFVFRRQVADHVNDDDLAGKVTYRLQHQRSSRVTGPDVVGGFASVTPWDEFGRRTVTLTTRRGTEPIIQGITELKPDISSIRSLKHDWDYRIDTQTISPEVIQSLIEQASDRDAPAERKAAVQFYLQAEMFPQAEAELRRLVEDFSEYTEWTQEFERQILEVKARRALHELERRRDAGQHNIAYVIARKFPADRVSADVLRGAQDIAEDYEQALRDRERAMIMLDMLQAELPLEQADRLRPLRAMLVEEIHYETIGRLQPFLRAVDDDSLTPDQKLALAYSGWILGSSEAVLDLNEAIRLWDARFLVLEFLRTDRDPLRERELLSELEATEGAGTTRLAQMIPLLPLPFEPPEQTPSLAFEVDVPVDPDQTPVRYTMMLPPEYSPHHRYPLLVVLRGQGRTFQNELYWWAGDRTRPGWGQRRGYIVVAPHYCDESETSYSAGESSHEVVLNSIQHLRKRYRVDSDRIFLAGHGIGADACFDIGMSHPDLFAGAIPICGTIDRYATFYWKNAPHLAWYIVAGERDRNTLDQNAPTINRMMKNAYDVIYCDYKIRGFESYSEELERIFDWMQLLKRAPLSEADRFEAGSLRRSDNRFYWMQALSLPERLFPTIVWDEPGRRTPRRFSGTITPGGTIAVDHPGQRTRIWLNPELFDFDNRCKVRINRRNVFNDFISPSMEVMLTDLRERGDRERLFWARLDL